MATGRFSNNFNQSAFKLKYCNCNQTFINQRRSLAGCILRKCTKKLIQISLPANQWSPFQFRGLGGVVGLTLPMARANRGSRPVYYLPCSDLGQVVNLSLSVA